MIGGRGLLVMLALVGALVLGLWLTSGEPTSPDPTEPALPHPVLSADRIALRSQVGVQPTVLGPAPDGQFLVREPLEDVASRSRLHQLAVVYDSAQLWKVKEASKVDAHLLEQTGLAQPRGEIEVRYGDEVVRLEIGDDGPIGNDVYVRRDGAIYMGSKALLSAIGGNVDDFRERAVFRNDLTSMERVSIRRPDDEGGGRTLTLERDAGQMMLVEPVQARANNKEAHAFVAAVLGMQADHFLGGNLAPPDEADYRIEVHGSAGDETVTLWQQLDGSALALQEPRNLGFKIDPGRYARLLGVSVERLRSRLVNPFPPGQLSKIVLDPGPDRGRPAELQRGGTDNVLQLVGPVRSSTDEHAVAKLLDGFGHLVAMTFEPAKADDLPGYGLGPDAFRVVVTGPYHGKPVEIRLGNDAGEQLTYAMRVDEPWVVKVPTEAADALRQPWTAFVTDSVYPGVEYGRIQKVRFVDDGKARVWHKEHGTWIGPDGQPDDQFDLLVDVLAGLQGEGVVDPATIQDLGAPTLIELEDGNGAPIARLELFPHDDSALIRQAGDTVLHRLTPQRARSLLR